MEEFIVDVLRGGYDGGLAGREGANGVGDDKLRRRRRRRRSRRRRRRRRRRWRRWWR